MCKKYTMQEVSAHNKPNDLWIVINGNVYDVTKFVKDVRIGDMNSDFIYINIHIFSRTASWWRESTDECGRKGWHQGI